MPYLRITTAELPISRRREIAQRLTDEVNELFYNPRAPVSREELRERTTVHVTPYGDNEMFIGARTPQERGGIDMTVELSDWSMSEKQQRKIGRRVTAVLGELFAVALKDIDGINIRFHPYPPKDFAVGGRLLSDIVPFVGQMLKKGFPVKTTNSHPRVAFLSFAPDEQEIIKSGLPKANQHLSGSPLEAPIGPRPQPKAGRRPHPGKRRHPSKLGTATASARVALHSAHHRVSWLRSFPGGGGDRREARPYPQNRGMSQKEAAATLGVDPSTLSRWERGERNPSGAHRESVDEFLKMSKLSD